MEITWMWRNPFFKYKSKILFLNTKVNAGLKHSKPLENIAPVHHLEFLLQNISKRFTGWNCTYAGYKFILLKIKKIVIF
jgi:hypothetical protein